MKLKHDVVLPSASNALTGEGLHEGVEWLTGIFCFFSVSIQMPIVI